MIDKCGVDREFGLGDTQISEIRDCAVASAWRRQWRWWRRGWRRGRGRRRARRCWASRRSWSRPRPALASAPAWVSSTGASSRATCSRVADNSSRICLSTTIQRACGRRRPTPRTRRTRQPSSTSSKSSCSRSLSARWVGPRRGRWNCCSRQTRRPRSPARSPCPSGRCCCYCCWHCSWQPVCSPSSSSSPSRMRLLVLDGETVAAAVSDTVAAWTPCCCRCRCCPSSVAHSHGCHPCARWSCKIFPRRPYDWCEEALARSSHRRPNWISLYAY